MIPNRFAVLHGRKILEKKTRCVVEIRDKHNHLVEKFDYDYMTHRIYKKQDRIPVPAHMSNYFLLDYIAYLEQLPDEKLPLLRLYVAKNEAISRGLIEGERIKLDGNYMDI